MDYRNKHNLVLNSQQSIQNCPQDLPPPKPQHYKPNSYTSVSPKTKHWKTYLAPELSHPNHTQYPQSHQQSYEKNTLKPQDFAQTQLLGAPQQSKLQNWNGLHTDNRALQKDPLSQNYTRRKDQIMNRIKALQDKTLNRQNNQCKNQSKNKYQNDINIENLQSRVSSLQVRIVELQSRFEERLQKAITELQLRINKR